MRTEKTTANNSGGDNNLGCRICARIQADLIAARSHASVSVRIGASGHSFLRWFAIPASVILGLDGYPSPFRDSGCDEGQGTESPFVS